MGRTAAQWDTLSDYLGVLLPADRSVEPAHPMVQTFENEAPFASRVNSGKMYNKRIPPGSADTLPLQLLQRGTIPISMTGLDCLERQGAGEWNITV